MIDCGQYDAMRGDRPFVPEPLSKKEQKARVRWVKAAWVSGSKRNGYVLCVLPTASTVAFAKLNNMVFLEFRAAQDLANAINAHMAGKNNPKSFLKFLPPRPRKVQQQKPD